MPKSCIILTRPIVTINFCWQAEPASYSSTPWNSAHPAESGSVSHLGGQAECGGESLLGNPHVVNWYRVQEVAA